MKSKTVLITGASSGIGKEAAIRLAEMGANILLVCRPSPHATTAHENVTRAAKGGKVELLTADLSSQAEVRSLAQVIQSRYTKLDVLLNNAGALFAERTITADGIERTFATNHLAYFLLTHLLLDLLKRSAPARIVSVSSGAQAPGIMNWEDLLWEKGYSGFKVYCQSKLANVLFTYELARRLEGTRVTANCLHPGFVRTGFGSRNGLFMDVMMAISQPFAIPASQGAKTSIYLASSPEVDGITGKYFYKCKPARTCKLSYDLDAAKRLWDLSAKMIGLP